MGLGEAAHVCGTPSPLPHPPLLASPSTPHTASPTTPRSLVHLNLHSIIQERLEGVARSCEDDIVTLRKLMMADGFQLMLETID
ncbi:unnamed protein product [Mesocestoides corti]|uniref:Uncharacterized protein n=1 Tax=Mesocestoides corti TaxID=53468 RepID=A0A3P6GGH1_MESCO|nr:unnamed protein product [Mesocestoides corti]